MWQMLKTVLSDPRVHAALLAAALVLIRVWTNGRSRSVERR